MHEWRDFHLTVDGQVGSYMVEARGPAGSSPSPEPLLLPVSDDAFWSRVAHIQQGAVPSLPELQQVGEALFTALFPRLTLGTYMATCGALSPEARLRLALNVRPPELHALPWELLYDPFGAAFVVADRQQALVRTLDSPLEARPLTLRGPLRLLHVSANPPDTERLDLTASHEALQRATSGWAEVVSLAHASPETLREALRQGPFHLLHYDGHAALDEHEGTGHLLLEDETGDIAPLPAEMLANYLSGTDVQLVVLAGCETALPIASILARRNVPAVLGMHYRVPDAAMGAFSGAFYTSLRNDAPVEEALVEARLALRSADSTGAWLAPLLYLRTSEGRLWQQATSDEAARGPTTVYKATLTGDGAIAQGKGARAVGAGGVYIGGNASDNQIITGHNNVVGGRDVQSGGIRFGDRARVTGDVFTGDKSIHPGGGTDLITLAQLFDRLTVYVAALAPEEQEEMRPMVEGVQKQLTRIQDGDESEQAQSVLARRLQHLKTMAGDISEVVLATLANPASGAALVVQKVAQRVQAET